MRPIRIAFPSCPFGDRLRATKVTERESKVRDEKLPRPERIIVYDFVANPALRPSATYF
jgi:hypothetical protein